VSNDLVEFDDIWVIEQLEYLHLTVDFSQVIIVQSRFIDNLNCNLYTQRHMHECFPKCR